MEDFGREVGNYLHRTLLFPGWRITVGQNRVLSGKPVTHPEPVQEAIRIPPAPDASASTPPARAPTEIAVRTLNVRSMSYCTEEACFLSHAPNCHDAAHREE